MTLVRDTDLRTRWQSYVTVYKSECSVTLHVYNDTYTEDIIKPFILNKELYVTQIVEILSATDCVHVT